jgi:hypothetical protein
MGALGACIFICCLVSLMVAAIAFSHVIRIGTVPATGRWWR